MSQKDQFIALIKSFGLTEGNGDRQFQVDTQGDGSTTVSFPNVCSDVCAEFSFGPDGKFVDAGVGSFPGDPEY